MMTEHKDTLAILLNTATSIAPMGSRMFVSGTTILLSSSENTAAHREDLGLVIQLAQTLLGELYKDASTQKTVD